MTDQNKTKPDPMDALELAALEGVSAPINAATVPLRWLRDFVDAFPFVSVGLLVVAFYGVSVLAGCSWMEPKTQSPTTGAEVTQSELQVELDNVLLTRDQAVDRHMENAQREINAATELDAGTDLIVDQYVDANEDLNDKREQRGAFWDAAGAVVARTPFGAEVWPVLSLLLGADVGRKQLKIRRQRKQLAASTSSSGS